MHRTRLAQTLLLLALCLVPGARFAAHLDGLHGTSAVASEDAGHEAEDAAEHASDDAAEKAAQLAEARAEKAAEDAAHAAEVAAEKAAQEAADTAEKAAETIAEDAADEAENLVEDTVEDSVDATEEAAEKAADEAETIAERVAEQAAEDTGDVVGNAEDASGQAEDPVEEVDDSMDEADEPDDEEVTRDGTGEDAPQTRPTDERERASDRAGRDRAGLAGSRVAERIASAADATFAGIGSDENGNEIGLGVWLVLATPDEVQALERLGYVTRSLEPLAGLGRVLAQLEAPASFDIHAAQAAIREVAPRAQADLNHLYRTGSAADAATPAGEAPRAMYPLLGDATGEGLRIGLIDTAIDRRHPALNGARIEARDFVPYDANRPTAHGTSIASILVGQSADAPGLLPRARVDLASVFFDTAQGGTTASAVSLVRAMDWLVAERVPVVNMSLAGPPNAILESAITRGRELGTLVVAAVGNRGPAAKPLYPAGYPAVVAVTAIDAARQVYRLANRGPHVDFAAPGVDVRNAVAGGTAYQSSSGTSLAAPFVAAVIAVSCGADPAPDPCLRRLDGGALDLGAPGFDPVFGYGLVRPFRS